MITAIFPRTVFSENRMLLNQTIKKYNMSWDGERDGWVDKATGDGVFIDKETMEIIMEEVVSDKPVRMSISSKNENFLKEFESICSMIGCEIAKDHCPPVPDTPLTSTVKSYQPRRKNIFIRLNTRDESNSTTDEFKEKAYSDLQDISGRWERRKRQLLQSYAQCGFDKAIIDDMLHCEEIAFRKNNACWVTGEFPGINTMEKQEETEL